MAPSPSTPATEGLALGELLAALARGAIAERLGEAVATVELAGAECAPLREPGACFVTLTAAGELRGCIGSLEAYRELLADLCANAASAAFGDPRFAPMARGELALVAIEVSVLGPLEPLAVAGEEEARRALCPHRDGVVLTCGGYRGTFLPQVWEQLPDPVDFLRQLRRKAGLPPDFWSPAVRLSRYRVDAHHEAPHRPALAPARGG